MATRQAISQQTDFGLGAFPGHDPFRIPPGGCRDVVNGLTGDEDVIYRRGGSANKSNAALGSSGLTFIWDGFLIPGRRTIYANTDDFAVLGSDDATPVNAGGDGIDGPTKGAVLDGHLFIPPGILYGGSQKSSNYSTGTVTKTNGSAVVTGSGTSWLANVDPGMLFQIPNEGSYIVKSVDSNTQITLAKPYAGATFSGHSYTLNVLGGLSSALADHYAAVANRMVAGGFNTGGTFPNRVYFSDVNDPLTYSATNYHALPESARIVGLETLGQTLFIFTTAGLWTLDGLAFDIVDADGNPQHRLEHVSPDLICFGGAGVASSGNSLVVPCTDGIFEIDGVSAPRRLSNSIDPYYRDYVEASYQPGIAKVYRGHYFLPILDGSNAVQDLLVCRLDRPRQSSAGVVYPWTRFTESGGNVTAFAVRLGSTQRDPELYGASGQSASRVLDCSGYFEPAAANKNDADGTTHDFTVTQPLSPTGGGTLNNVRKVRARYELDDAGSDNPTIEASYTPDLVSFTSLSLVSASAPEDATGTGAFVWRVGKKLREVAVRLTCNDPAAKLVLRSIETFVRPSQATRR